MADHGVTHAAFFTEAPDGQLAFTAAGRAFYTAYFGYAGVDLRRIKTRADLHQASRAAFPSFFAFMAQRLAQRQQTLETRALLAIIREDADALARIDRQLQTGARLHVLTGSRAVPPAQS
jgi:hypothetical protein